MDLADFEEIPRRQRKDVGMTVTLGDIFLSLNKEASEAFGDATHIKLLANIPKRQIAIIPTEAGHKVTRRKGAVTCSIMALRTRTNFYETGRFRATPLEGGGFLVQLEETK